MPETNAKVASATRMVEALSELLKDSPVREGPAGLKGRGVFATRAMRRGDVCTAYPCDMLSVTDGGGGPSQSTPGRSKHSWKFRGGIGVMERSTKRFPFFAPMT